MDDLTDLDVANERMQTTSWMWSLKLQLASEVNEPFAPTN